MQNLEKECADIVTKKPTEGKEGKEEEETKPVEVDHLKGKDGIPDFWWKAIKNNQMVFELVKEKDEEILQHVRHIETERSEKPKALTVKFHFNDNEFFDNKELSLKVVYKNDSDAVDRIEGTTINWKEGKDPTKKKVKKKQKHKKTNETRTIVKTVEAESFFNNFNNRVAPTGDLDSEEENELHDKIDEATNLAEDIADVLIPDALEYYLGLNEDFDEADMMGDDDDEDDDHDSDNDDGGAGGKKKGGKKGGDKAAGAQGKEG